MKRKYIRKAEEFLQRIKDSTMGNGLMQEETSAAGESWLPQGIESLIRQAGAESCVLLKNEGVLPISAGRPVAVFGRCQLDWFYVGYGSGGDVHAPYLINLIDGLQNAGITLDNSLLESYRRWTSDDENLADRGWWGHWPLYYPEMPLDEAICREAAKNADTALIVIGRAAGEDRDNKSEAGSWYLTDTEFQMLDRVTEAFDKVIVLLNIGNIIDMSWTERYGDRISGLMIVWQTGMESGNAVADVLTGRVSPSGRLPDTVARDYKDYPGSSDFGSETCSDYKEGIFVGYRHFDTAAVDNILYPFGFGLSYTAFALEAKSFEQAADGVKISVKVTNTGPVPGKRAVLIWCRQPAGRLEKAVHVLCGFGKTRELQPGRSQTLDFSVSCADIASYDEDLHAFVLEKGLYRFSADSEDAGELYQAEEVTVRQCTPICTGSSALRKRILDGLPGEVSSGRQTESDAARKVFTLQDVRDGTIDLDTFVTGLSDEELEALTRGAGSMNSSMGTAGNAGAFGGVILSLRQKGIRPLITADGPAGLRLHKYCALLPSGTALASTWNTELVELLYSKDSEAMTHYSVDIRLAPGMNIHRNPLCGRNFEYFSEDPLLSGRMAAAVIRGIQSHGHGACPKHFACNNQETARHINDSRVSERALREIYLRNFEIAVREGKPKTLMSSYNKVNGVWSHYNYTLATTVLRNEWGFEGVILTDWWMRKSYSPEFPKLRDNAYRVRAGVDVLMPGNMKRTAKRYKSDGTLLETLGRTEGITRGELQAVAKRVLRLVLELG